MLGIRRAKDIWYLILRRMELLGEGVHVNLVDIVIILDEGNLPHPRLSQCNMLVPWRALNGKHHDTAMCRSGAERKRRRVAETELQENTERAFEAYGNPIEAVPSFNYLGRIMTVGDDNWPAVAGNLLKARKSWGRLTRIVSR